METKEHRTPVGTEVDAVVGGLIEEIMAEADPLRIILFGLRATGIARPDSDIDLLVVMPEGTPCRQAMGRMGSRIDQPEVDVDVIVATPSLLERHANNPGLIYREALRTGRTIYPLATIR